jgi:hypothetical protein
MKNVSMLFQDLLCGPTDAPLLTDAPSDGEGECHVFDPVGAFFKTAELGAFLGPGESGFQHARNLLAEFAPVETLLAGAYRKLAEADATLAKQKFEPDGSTRSPVLFARPVGTPLAKGDLTLRMRSLIAELEPACIGNEATLLEKSVAALDVSAFAEIAEGIVRRLKARRAA